MKHPARPFYLVSLLSALLAFALPASAGAYIYWGTSNNQSLVGRANLDGSEPNTNFVPGLEGIVHSVAVNDSHVYWIDRNHIPTRIGRANLDGSEVITNFVSGSQAESGLIVSGNYIYWAGSDSVGRANLNGTEVESDFIPTGDGISQVAVGGDHVYWTDNNLNLIDWAKIEGGEPESKPLFVGKELEGGIAAGEDGLFFANGEKGIGFVGFTGGLTIESAIPGAGGDTMAVNGDHVYWAGGGNIGRANLDGSELDQNFVTLPSGGAFGVAVDSATSPPPPPPMGGNPAPLPLPSPIVAPRPLKCKAGFKKQTVKGKAKCVKVKKHHKRHHPHH